MFKKIFLLPILAIFASSCTNNDDGFYNETYIQAQNNLVSIEQQPSYAVNDAIYINAIIPRLLQEKDFPTFLDVRQSTGNADKFNLTVILEKKATDGTWQYVDLTNKYIVDEGIGIAGTFVKGTLVYNNSFEEYRWRGGISLTEIGDYRMGFGITSSASRIIEMRSESPGQNLQMNLKTSADALDGSGRYNFVVD